MGRLARWLGPWTPDAARPRSVARRTVRVAGERSFDAWVYRKRGRRPVGALLVLPGLHYLGPADPRLDRFLAVLAEAGLLVFAPFLPDFTALRVSPGVVDDADDALTTFLALPEFPKHLRPGVFSISFGSMPALKLCSRSHRASEVGGLVTFGGFADWAETVRFALKGDGTLPHDPLNRPVVFMNLLDHLPGVTDADGLMSSWRMYVESTWGRPEMKERARYEPVAQELSADVDAAQRELFMMGIGLSDGGDELALSALERAGDAYDWMSPLPHLAGLRCPTWLVHGRDDDVIPFHHARALAEALPQRVISKVCLTGLYAHTGHAGGLRRMLPTLAGELRAMVGILEGITAAATTQR